MRRTIAVLALGLAAGCSGHQATAPTTPATTTPTTTTPAPAYPGEPAAAKALADRAGCARPTDTPDADKLLYIAQAADCLDPAWTVKSETPGSYPDATVSFYIFNNNAGRDAWLETAATFGDHGVIKGDRWAVEIPDGLPHLDSVAQQIAARLGGERVL